MAGNERHRRRVASIRYGHAGVGGGRDRGRDAGNDLERDAGVVQGLGLFTTSPVDERISALQADDPLPLRGQEHQEMVELILLEDVAAVRLADEDALGPVGSQVEEIGMGEAVVDDDVGLGEEVPALHGDEPGIAGSGPHEGYSSDPVRGLLQARWPRFRGTLHPIDFTPFLL